MGLSAFEQHFAFEIVFMDFGKRNPKSGLKISFFLRRHCLMEIALSSCCDLRSRISRGEILKEEGC